MGNSKTGGNRERLLEAALRCIQEKGYARTTARDLVAASGTNLNSIGYHFGSKEALLNEAIAIGVQEWIAEIEQTTFGPEDARGAERFQRGLAAVIYRFEELRPLLVSFVEAFPPAVRSAELRERMAQMFEETRDAIATMFVRAFEEEGVTLGEGQADTLATLLGALSDGLLLLWLLDPEAVPTPEQVAEAVAAFGARALPAASRPS